MGIHIEISVYASTVIEQAEFQIVNNFLTFI